MSSVGSDLYGARSFVFESRLEELDDGEGERSRFVRAMSKSWDFAACLRAILRACDRNAVREGSGIRA